MANKNYMHHEIIRKCVEGLIYSFKEVNECAYDDEYNGICEGCDEALFQIQLPCGEWIDVELNNLSDIKVQVGDERNCPNIESAIREALGECDFVGMQEKIARHNTKDAEGEIEHQHSLMSQFVPSYYL